MMNAVTSAEETARVAATDLRQISGYAASLNKQALPVSRLPVDRHPGGLLTGLRWGGESPAVLLHGGQLNAHTWDGVLLHAGIPALAYDLPGHGQSLRMDPGAYTLAAVAGVVADGIQRDTAGPVTLVGHSFGGTIALAVAARWPGLCRELVLLDCTPHGVGTANEDPETLLAGTLDELVDSVHLRVPDRRRGSLLRGVMLNAREREDGLWEWSWDPAFKADSDARGAERQASWNDVENLTVPVTLVRGERSEKVTSSMVADFCARQPGTRTLVAPGAGHNLHTDAPAWTADLLAQVLQGAPGAL